MKNNTRRTQSQTNPDPGPNGHQPHASDGFADVEFIYDNIPQPLRECDQWVSVRLVHATDAAGEDIVIKKPVDPKPGMQARDAKSNDPDTWGTFQDACNLLPFYNGLGYVFAATDPHAGLDLDHCRDKTTGAIADWAQPLIDRCGTYTEISQSGEGVKLIGLGTVPTGGHSRVYQSGKVEMYDDRRFFMLTGNHLPGTPTTISDITVPLAAIHQEVWGSSGDDHDSDHSAPRQGVGLDARDLALFGKIVRSKQGAVFLALWSKRPTTDNANTSDEDAALVRRLAWWLNRDTARMDRWFRASARMRPKWDSVRYAANNAYGSHYGQHLITLAVTEWVKPGDGYTGEDTGDDFFADDAPGDSDSDGADAGNKTFNRSYRLLTDDECEMMPPARGILGDILYEATVGLLYGPSNRWKSFLALDWALCIATGKNWLGQDRFPVRQGTVIYIAAEGARGLGKRIRAWKRAHGISGRTPLRVLPHALTLLEEGSGTEFVQAVRAQLEDGDTPTLIVIDTLARSLVGGDENSTKDAELLMSKASRLREIFDCCVLFVHHTGYDTSHARGNTVFYNDADSVMTIAWNGEGGKPEPGDPVRLVSRKVKDDDDFRPVTITTELQTWLGADQDGEQVVGSLVVVPFTGDATSSAPHSPEAPPKATYSDAAIKAWRALVKLCLDAPKGVTMKGWEQVTVGKGLMARSTLYEAYSAMMQGGWVQVTDKLIRAAVPGHPDPMQEGEGLL